MKKLEIDQMETVGGKIPCGVAMGLYLASFVGGCLTGGAGLAAGLAVISIAGSIWGVSDSCKYVF